MGVTRLIIQNIKDSGLKDNQLYSVKDPNIFYFQKDGCVQYLLNQDKFDTEESLKKVETDAKIYHAVNPLQSAIDLSEICLSDKNVGEYTVLYFRGAKQVFSHWLADFELNDAVFNDFISNFKKKVIGTDVPVNYSHNRVGEGAGWYKALKKISNGKRTDLKAEIEWTPAAAQAIRDKVYKYFSAEFTLNGLPFKNSETGKEYDNVLVGGALTNIPFLKDTPVTLSLPFSSDMHDKPEKIKILKGELKMSKEELILSLKNDFDIDVAALQVEIAWLSSEIDIASKVNVKLEDEVKAAEKTFMEYKAEIEKEKIKCLLNDLIKQGRSTQDLNENVYAKLCVQLSFDEAKAILAKLPEVHKFERKSEADTPNTDARQNKYNEIKAYADKKNVAFHQAEAELKNKKS